MIATRARRYYISTCVTAFCLFFLLILICFSSTQPVVTGSSTAEVVQETDNHHTTTNQELAKEEELASIEPWGPATNPRASASDLHKEYSNIFRYGNRNAASHLWSTFLLQRSNQMTESQLLLFFSSFCAVSGSPIRPSDYNRYRLTLPMVPPSNERQQIFRTGYMHYCCWPCVCDTQDFIRIDTKTITLRDGHTKQYAFAVIGNPCDHPEELTKPFIQPFYGRRETTIEMTAPEVRCNVETGDLEGATLSDNGYIIISMFFDSQDAKILSEDGNGGLMIAPGAFQEPLVNPTPGRMSSVHNVDNSVRRQFQDEREYVLQCENRAKNGYNSGMGEIFRKVSAISPIPTIIRHDTINYGVELVEVAAEAEAEANQFGSLNDDHGGQNISDNKSNDTAKEEIVVEVRTSIESDARSEL